MASHSSILSEEQLRCSIYLCVFNHPICTPCGHRFCLTCISDCWDSSQQWHCCPNGKEVFLSRPRLSVTASCRSWPIGSGGQLWRRCISAETWSWRQDPNKQANCRQKEQCGAAEAFLTHNPEVDVSKPSSARQTQTAENSMNCFCQTWNHFSISL